VHRLYNEEEGSGVTRLVADVSLAAKLLEWTPRTSLRDGLEKILKLDPRFRITHAAAH
jgi:hypothetical protein